MIDIIVYFSDRIESFSFHFPKISISSEHGDLLLPLKKGLSIEICDDAFGDWIMEAKGEADNLEMKINGEVWKKGTKWLLKKGDVLSLENLRLEFFPKQKVEETQGKLFTDSLSKNVSKDVSQNESTPTESPSSENPPIESPSSESPPLDLSFEELLAQIDQLTEKKDEKRASYANLDVDALIAEADKLVSQSSLSGQPASNLTRESAQKSASQFDSPLALKAAAHQKTFFPKIGGRRWAILFFILIVTTLFLSKNVWLSSIHQQKDEETLEILTAAVSTMDLGMWLHYCSVYHSNPDEEDLSLQNLLGDYPAYLRGNHQIGETSYNYFVYHNKSGERFFILARPDNSLGQFFSPKPAFILSSDDLSLRRLVDFKSWERQLRSQGVDALTVVDIQEIPEISSSELEEQTKGFTDKLPGLQYGHLTENERGLYNAPRYADFFIPFVEAWNKEDISTSRELLDKILHYPHRVMYMKSEQGLLTSLQKRSFPLVAFRLKDGQWERLDPTYSIQIKSSEDFYDRLACVIKKNEEEKQNVNAQLENLLATASQELILYQELLNKQKEIQTGLQTQIETVIRQCYEEAKESPEQLPDLMNAIYQLKLISGIPEELKPVFELDENTVLPAEALSLMIASLENVGSVQTLDRLSQIALQKIQREEKAPFESRFLHQQLKKAIVGCLENLLENDYSFSYQDQKGVQGLLALVGDQEFTQIYEKEVALRLTGDEKEGAQDLPCEKALEQALNAYPSLSSTALDDKRWRNLRFAEKLLKQSRQLDGNEQEKKRQIAIELIEQVAESFPWMWGQVIEERMEDYQKALKQEEKERESFPFHSNEAFKVLRRYFSEREKKQTSAFVSRLNKEYEESFDQIIISLDQGLASIDSLATCKAFVEEKRKILLKDYSLAVSQGFSFFEGHGDQMFLARLEKKGEEKPIIQQMTLCLQSLKEELLNLPRDKNWEMHRDKVFQLMDHWTTFSFN